MKNVSTGAGLVVLGLGIALHPLVSGLVAQATAAPSSPLASAAAAVASAATAQAGPTVVWMGVTSHANSGVHWVYHRLWSDGRLETRSLPAGAVLNGACYEYIPAAACSYPWREVPPPPGGNAVACRTDINGDGLVGSSDLSLLLNDWGQEGRCEPTYPCLDLGNLAGGVAFK